MASTDILTPIQIAFGERDRVKVFGFVLSRRAERSIAMVCRVLAVSRSGDQLGRAGAIGEGRAGCPPYRRIRELHALRRRVYAPRQILADFPEAAVLLRGAEYQA